jgi:hypothetical protein
MEVSLVYVVSEYRRKERPLINPSSLLCTLGGKSAILTGLTIALGAKATITNRASNLGALVKGGTRSV